MPLPKPTANESQSDFIGRCMGDEESKKEFPDTKQRVAVCVDLYKKETLDEHSNAEVSETVEKGLKKKLEDHKEKVGKDPKKQTTLRKLKIVYNRGIGAYRSNPSSVRPSVGSPEQWASARVNSFLYALRNLRYRSGKHDTDLLPKEHPIRKNIEKDKASFDEHRRYEDGEIIPSELPPAYRKSRKGGETKGQACINCKFYKEDHKDGEEKHRFYCTHWKAPVRPQYWCKAWKATSEALEETYNDYPESASNNAKRALKYKEENPDNKCGTLVGWARANQLAKKEKISRDTIARMASFKRHQQNKDVPYDEGCGGLMWDAWGGTSGVEWAIRKLKQIDKKMGFSMDSKLYGFSALGIEDSKIDRESGKMFGVSLISVGEALGHELYVDERSIDTILDSINGERLPAYITHQGALFQDRLTREIGMFTNFRKDGERLLADFEAFDSFREDDSKKFNRLFEMAEKMPERFGLSIVFSASQAWATPDGDVQLDSKPEDALFDFPSIRVEEVSSADFVDTPAANQKGLFSTNQIKNMEQSEINEATEEEVLEAQLSVEEDSTEVELSKHEEGELEKETELEGHEDDKMEGHEEEEKLEEKVASLESVIDDLKEKLKEKEEMISKLQEELGGHEDKEKEMQEEKEEMEAKLSKLSALIKGTNPIKVSKFEDDSNWSPSKSLKSQLIRDYAKENNISEFTATLRLGKEKPELFKL